MQPTSDQDLPARSTLADPWTKGGFGASLMGYAFAFLFVLVFIAVMLPALGASHHPRPRAVLYVYRDSSGVVLESGQRPDTASVAQVIYGVFTHRVGLPAALQTTEKHWLMITPTSTPVSDPQIRAAVGTYLATHANDPDLASIVPYASRIAAGNFTITIWHPIGVVIDAGCFVLFIAAVVFAAFRVRRAYRRAVQRARESTPGLCPACGYSTLGLTGTTCPECGHMIAQHASQS